MFLEIFMGPDPWSDFCFIGIPQLLFFAIHKYLMKGHIHKIFLRQKI